MKVLAHVNRLQEKFYYVLNGLLIVFEQVAAPGVLAGTYTAYN